MVDRKVWPEDSYEERVERLYSTGIEGFHNFHGGYLNFGLWEGKQEGYVHAAENMVGTLANMIGMNKSSHVVDVACGMGAQDILLHRLYGCTIDAVDVTWKHVLRARERVARAKLWNDIKIHHETATALPFPSKSFTHVLCVEGAEHFDTREKFLREAYRVLVPGGRIGLADFVLKREPRTLLERTFVRLGMRLWHIPEENGDSAEVFRRKLFKVGFRKIRFREVGAQVIPGYYREHRRREVKAETEKVRGYWATHAGWLMDYAAYRLFVDGVLEYVLVSAEK